MTARPPVPEKDRPSVLAGQASPPKQPKAATAKGQLKQVLKGALLFLPLVVLVAVVNVLVDPAGLYQREYERHVAETITSGMNAAQLKNMDDRSFERYCAQLLPTAPDTLVLGSSRCMQLTAEGLACEGLFNAGVTNGELRDMISLYELYKSLDKLPRRVILMTDYCMFNPAKLDNRANTQGYADFCARTGTEELRTTPSMEKWKQLFSPVYFQTALHFLEVGGSNDILPTQDYETDSDMRRYDGSYSYGPLLRDMTPEERDENGRFTSYSIAHNMGSFSPNSPVLRQQFELFVQQMQADGVVVVFQLPPINPYMYATMAADEAYATQIALEDYFRAFAMAHDIGVFGSYDPAKLGLVSTDFYDALHCTREATNSYLPDWLKEG